MSEKRLIEIASTISMLNGQLVILGYLSSLSESDMYLFIKCVKGSKYGNENFYEAVKSFSNDLLEKKEIIVSNDCALKFGYKEGNYEDYFSNSSFSKYYFDEMNGVVNSDKYRK